MAPPRKRKSHDSSDELGFSQGLDSFGGERMARRLKRKGIIAPQTVPINPVEEWDDDLREFMQSFYPSVVADYGCEDGVGVNGNTRTHNVVEDSTRVSSDNVSIESLDMDRDHNDEGFYSDEFVANVEDAPIHDVRTDVDDDDDNGFIDDLDPQYMVFLANLVEDGTSYVLQVALGNGRSIIVNYEPVDGPVQECNPVDVVDTPIVCSSGTKTRKDMRSGTRQGRTEPLCDSRKDTMETQRKSSSIPVQKRKKSLVERREKAAADHVASRVKGDSSKRATPGLNNRDHQREVSMVDLSYQSFLGALRRDGNQTVFMSGINEEMLYEQNEESTSDSEVVLLDGIVAPIVICPDDDGTVGVQNESSEFREGLMEILKKPYSREEHVRLRKIVSHRRAREQIHRLRSGDKSYPTKFMAKSYLDLHPDLQSQIVSAKPNKPKILNLLRGFFYWLQHVTRNASFKPWLDASCDTSVTTHRYTTRSKSTVALLLKTLRDEEEGVKAHEEWVTCVHANALTLTPTSPGRASASTLASHEETREKRHLECFQAVVSGMPPARAFGASYAVVGGMPPTTGSQGQVGRLKPSS